VLVAAAVLPAGDAFLSPREQARAKALRFDSRRQDFRLGRFAARLALGAWLEVPTPGPDVEIAAATDGAPEVRVAGAPSISLSHRAGHAACAITRPGLALGVDLEHLEPRSDELVDQFFTPAEQAMVREAGPDRDRCANLIWSAKESAAKALREGLRLDTRALEVRLERPHPLSGWASLQVSSPAGVLSGWWRIEGALVLTAAALGGIAQPVRLVPG
jgi:phosphopantetheinyl transferase